MFLEDFDFAYFYLLMFPQSIKWIFCISSLFAQDDSIGFTCPLRGPLQCFSCRDRDFYPLILQITVSHQRKIMDTLSGEIMTLCWLNFVKMSLYQPELVLFCSSQVSLYRKPMSHLSQVVPNVIQQSTLLPIHSPPSCMLSQIMQACLRRGSLEAAFLKTMFWCNGL